MMKKILEAAYNAISTPGFEELRKLLKETDMKEMIYNIPEGYEFDCVENGVIKFKEAKKELPKTCEECISLLIKKECLHDVALSDAINAFQKLLIIRDVYRDGWKPNWNNNEHKYTIYTNDYNLCKGMGVNASRALSFQTEEIRDEFYDNFTNLIEEAKDLI